jgi:DNA-binding MarR family transcriptional regulator
LISSLSEKYAVDVLKYILQKGNIKKSDLLEIITSSWTLDKLIPKLEKDELISLSESVVGRRTYSISLTPKCRAVAEQLKKTDEAAKGVIIHEDEGRIEISKIPEEWKERWKNLHVLFRVNVYEDHITLMDSNYHGTGKERIFNIYVKENGQGAPEALVRR